MGVLPMFPLGSVLFPHMPLGLRVFEERYLIMLSTMVERKQTDFGVVLIERGHEVGGGEHRFELGTVASITGLGAQDGMVALTAVGRVRIAVTEWLTDDPHPRAETRELPELVWESHLKERFDETEQLVRRTLAQASEFEENIWPPDLELSDDPVAALWQLAGIAPIGELDQIALLRSTSAEELLNRITATTTDAAFGFGAR